VVRVVGCADAMAAAAGAPPPRRCHPAREPWRPRHGCWCRRHGPRRRAPVRLRGGALQRTNL